PYVGTAQRSRSPSGLSVGRRGGLLSQPDNSKKRHMAAAALSMITKEKHPMRVLFFRDHDNQRAQAGRRTTIDGSPPKELITARS
ncbi:MAG TPA: hypothetical protein VFE59_20290, partial [Trebonia sp.]|nr:hypothetical protein [Trebonia sp.]